MQLNSYYVLVKKIEEPVKEGFQAVEVQDSFVYKGEIVRAPEAPAYVDNHKIGAGDQVIFAKYSPDTHEVEIEGQKMKFVKVSDLLAVL